jgi:hypothetical protein
LQDLKIAKFEILVVLSFFKPSVSDY